LQNHQSQFPLSPQRQRCWKSSIPAAIAVVSISTTETTAISTATTSNSSANGTNGTPLRATTTTTKATNAHRRPWTLPTIYKQWKLETFQREELERVFDQIVNSTKKSKQESSNATTIPQLVSLSNHK
jgi:hypothetical protein